MSMEINKRTSNYAPPDPSAIKKSPPPNQIVNQATTSCKLIHVKKNYFLSRNKCKFDGFWDSLDIVVLEFL